MMKSKFFRIWIVLLLLIFSCGANALAGDTQDQKNWEFDLAPFYLWGINMDGNSTTGDSTTQLDVPFNDVFNSLEAAFIVHFEALHKSNFGLSVDLNAMDLSNTATIPMGPSLDIGLEIRLSEFSGIYRVKRDNHYFDAIFGLRYIDMSTTIAPAAGCQ